MERLNPEQLRRRCDPAQFDFETTEQLLTLEPGLSQERAREAFRLGTGIRKDGYNLFVMGSPGTGKHPFVFRALKEKARRDAAPPDLCYVNNFQHPHQPRVLSLPAGTGGEFRQDMEGLIEELRSGLRSAFESEEYRGGRKAIEEEIKERHDTSFQELQKRAEERGVKLMRTPEGLVFAPFREGRVLTPDEITALSEEKREQIQSDASDFHDHLHDFLQNIPDWEKTTRERIKELEWAVATATVNRILAAATAKYASSAPVVAFLEDLRADVSQNYSAFLRVQEPSLVPTLDFSAFSFRKYLVNLLVENDPDGGAPVIYEDNPTYQNLVGRVEYLAQMGALITDFNLIRPGALHRASGGYLVLDAYKLFLQPFAWDGLKRALRSQTVRIESPGQLVSAISTVSLEPEPIAGTPLVILVGERLHYYLLNALDPDFPELFKVPVDFEEELPRNLENTVCYARLVASIAKANALRPLTREAVARVIEEGARFAGDAEKLTARIESITDLLREANFWSGELSRDIVDVNDVQKAIDAKSRRNARIRDRILDETRRGAVLISTEGRRVGCVNGLAYLDQGNFAFGHPVRITAGIRMGRGAVIDIEREAKLGGPVHSKGVLILGGFLGTRYARDVPLSFAATLVFEQSYGIVEGDSASLAELCVLLSAIGEFALDQALAVTGSINQQGEVQAIGGVNEKVEGFYDLCRTRGLNGKQGVLIPASNVRNLMLRAEVVEAVKEGSFQLFPVNHVDEALELLSGIPVAQLNERIERRLGELAQRHRKFAHEQEEDHDKAA